MITIIHNKETSSFLVIYEEGDSRIEARFSDDLDGLTRITNYLSDNLEMSDDTPINWEEE